MTKNFASFATFAASVAAFAAVAVACANNTTEPTPGMAVCSANETACGGGCVDLSSDREHCGACDKGCGLSEACKAGKCELACAAPLTACDATGGARCVDTAKDSANCGACGKACAAGLVCTTDATGKPACGLVCAGGTTKCGDACVDTKIDDAHCGDCQTTCTGNTTCSNGGCCAPGRTNCLGTCVDTLRSSKDCGKCGTQCGASEVCVAGGCASPAKSCKEIKATKPAAPTGVYSVVSNGTLVPVYCDMTTDGGGWTLVAKLSRNVARDPLTAWSGPALNELDETFLVPAQRSSDAYVSRIVSLWNSSGGFPVTDARVHVYDGNVLAAYMKFTGLATSTSTSWFAKANLDSASWLDLKGASPGFFGIDGDSGVARRVFVSQPYGGGCGNDTGWIVADWTPDVCNWETGGGPTVRLLYAKGTSARNWNDTANVGLADTYAFFAR